jgi:antitoxin YefM
MDRRPFVTARTAAIASTATSVSARREETVVRSEDGRDRGLYNKAVAIETSYTRLRANLAAVLGDVALLPASELAGLMETAHLLRSPNNARRLLTALRRAEAR